jgi:putative ABC transport system permease protein
MTVPLDVRYGFRKLNNNAGFTIVAVTCLALGICASVTLFCLADALLLRPVPGIARQEGLVSLAPKRVPLAGLPGELLSKPLSYPLFLRYRNANHVLSDLVAFRPVTVNCVVAGEARRVAGQVVTENYFDVLGLRSAKGRFFGVAEWSRGAQPEVVISHTLWERAFGDRSQAIGSSVNLDGNLFVVAGVAPARFHGTHYGDEVDIWISMTAAPLVFADLRGGKLQDPDHAWLFWFFGRLAPGVDVARAQRELDLLAAQFAAGLKGERRPAELKVYAGIGIWPGTLNDLARPLKLLAAVVGLLMLVVCTNLGGLLLVKASARREEIGVRLALGVTRGRLLRQLLSESVALSLLGGGAGLILALWTVDALRGISLGKYVPRIAALSIDGRVVAFALGLSLATGILFGLIPALWTASLKVAPLLRPRASADGQEHGRNRVQEVFVVGQVTISLLLLVITGLFVRTLWNLQSIDPGFDSARILNLRLDLSPHRNDATSSGPAFYEQLLLRVRRLPEVRAASLTLWVPLSSANMRSRLAMLQPQAGPRGRKPLWSQYNVVSPGFFRTLEIQLRGRDFLETDRQGTPLVAIVDEMLARALWPGQSPIGERFTGTRGEIYEVVGVARNVRPQNLQAVPEPYFYVPLAQRYEPATTLQVRTGGDPLHSVDSILVVIHELESNLGTKVSLYADEVEEAFAMPRLYSWLLSACSLVAVVVTAIGLYGNLAYTVSRRTRELGIRTALGARSAEIVAMVLRRGLSLTLIGIGLGLTAAIWTTSIFSTLLFGVTPTDPAVFFFVALLLTLVGLVASSLPAYSATRIDPMAIIRHE